MSQEVGALHYDLDIDDKKLKGALDDADKQVEGFGSKISKHWGSAVDASTKFTLAIAAAGAAAVAFGVQSVNAYNGAVEATTKLRTNLLNVKGATEEHVKSLEKQASQLQSIGVIEDDVIKAGMSQLATFNLQGKTIEKLTPKITDMVAQLKGHNATAEDMVGINNLVGKVMTGNVGALSKYGVTLSENQKLMISNGDETQRAATLVEVLGQNYGNVNEALRNTPQGQITALKNAFGDLQEGVGELILAGLTPLVKTFGEWLTKVEEAGGFLEYFKNIIKENEDAFKLIAGAIIGGVIPALVAMAIAAVSAMAPLIPWMLLGAGIVWVADKIIEKMGGWQEAQKKLQPYLDKAKEWFETAKVIGVQVFNEIKDAAMGVYEIIRLLVTGDFRGGIFGLSEDSTFVDWLFKIRDGLQTIWDKFTLVIGYIVSAVVPVLNTLKAVWDFLYPSIAALASTLWDRLLPALKSIWDAVIKLWNALNPALMEALKIIGMVIGAIVVAAIWVFINALNIVISVISFVINIIATLIGWLANLISWYGNLWGKTIDMVKGIIDWFKKLPETVGNVVGGIVDWFKSLPDKIKNVIGGVSDAVQAPFKTAFNAIARFWNNTVGKLSFTAPDWVPAIGGKGFTMPKLPELAVGGIATGPVVAQIGEAGAEAVLPLSYMNRYTSLFDRIESTVRDITGSNISAGGGTTNITLQMDGIMARSASEMRDIFKEGLALVNQELRAKGKAEIGI